MVCVAIADGILWGGDAHSGGGVQGAFGKNAEQDMPQSGGAGAPSVVPCSHGGAEGGEPLPTLYVAQTMAVGDRKEGAHVARPTGGVAGRGAHVGDQQDVQQACNGPCAGLGLRRGSAWNTTVGNEGRSEFKRDAGAQE